MDNNFEDIRSYRDHEVAGVLNELIDEPQFLKAVRYVFPELSNDQIKGMFSGISSQKEFQGQIIYKTLERIISQTTKGIDSEGVDKLDKDQAFLFITNHRDIVLDSAFLNFILFDSGRDTTEIAIGDNLLIFPWITEVVKLNKSFVVKRSMPKEKIVEETIRLSNYIRHTIENNTSVWIAQREGRTKDGDDKTNPALLKMISLSGNNNVPEDFANLNVVPIAISYEYEPCDGYKVKELTTPGYKKTVQDDLESMFAGIFRPKGRVKFSFGQPLGDQLQQLNSATKKNEQLKLLAGIIDKNIYSLYHLWPTNYIAYDMLHKSGEFSHEYDEEAKKKFEEYMQYKFNLLSIEGDADERKKAFLNIYANPVINKLKLTNEQ